MGIAQCKTTVSTKVKNEEKAIARGQAESRAETVSFPLIIGRVKFCGAVREKDNMGLGQESSATAKLESVFGDGVLAGKTNMIIEAANRAGVDPNMFAAVIAHETGRGTSNAVQNYYNPAGIMDPQTKWTKLKKFNSLDEGLDYSAKNLKRRIDQVGGDIEKLAKVYAPIGAENDPNNLNSAWSQGVNKFYNMLVTTSAASEKH